MQNKDWMKEHCPASNSTYDKKYVIANVIVKDMACSVKIVPEYNKETGEITYTSYYSADPKGPYDVEYNQIVYNYDGKTKHMTTPKSRTIYGVDFSELQEDLNLKC